MFSNIIQVCVLRDSSNNIVGIRSRVGDEWKPTRPRTGLSRSSWLVLRSEIESIADMIDLRADGSYVYEDENEDNFSDSLSVLPCRFVPDGHTVSTSLFCTDRLEFFDDISETIQAITDESEDSPELIWDDGETWTSDLTGSVYTDFVTKHEYHYETSRGRIETGNATREELLHHVRPDFVLTESGEWWQKSLCHRYNGEWISQSEYEESFFTCDRCADVTHVDDMRGEDCSYCEHCWDLEQEENESRNGLQNYRDRIDFDPIREDGDYPLLGVELEVVGEDCAEEVTDLLGSNFILKEDGSLPDDGFEIVSQAMTLGIHVSEWSELLNNRPKKLGSFKYSECGLHVHIDREFLGDTDESRLRVSRRIAGLVMRQANRDFFEHLGGRDFNSYCLGEIKTAIVHTGKKGIDAEINRYRAVNLCNARTIELRFFKGNLKPSSFFASLELAEAIAFYCRDLKLPFWECVNAKKFADFVLSREDGRWSNIQQKIASFMVASV